MTLEVGERSRLERVRDSAVCSTMLNNVSSHQALSLSKEKKKKPERRSGLSIHVLVKPELELIVITCL